MQFAKTAEALFPAAETSAPVEDVAPSEARKTRAPIRSTGSPQRSAGMWSSTCLFVSGLLREDPLTGALNRRGLTASFERESARAERSGAEIVPFSPLADEAPPYRVYAIEPPVTYRCDLAAQTLTRYSGYGFLSTQPDPPSGGTAAILARRVSGCSFSYDQPAITARHALVTLTLQLTAQNETVTLYHTVHIDNLP